MGCPPLQHLSPSNKVKGQGRKGGGVVVSLSSFDHFSPSSEGGGGGDKGIPLGQIKVFGALCFYVVYVRPDITVMVDWA